jgi:hypothetical protein
MESIKYYYLLVLYLVILHIAPILNLFGVLPGGKPAYIIDLATLIPIALSFRYWTASRWNHTKTVLDAAVTSYLLFSILSIVLYLQPDNPSNFLAYFYGVHYFVLPMFLYYAIKAINRSRQTKFLLILCYLNVFAFALGILLYFTRPEFYNNYLRELLYASKGELLAEWQVFGRMQSYLGSTSMGVIAAMTIILLIQIGVSFGQLILFLPILYFGVVITFQRGGIFVSSIALSYAIYKMRGSLIYKSMIIMVLIVLIAVGIYQLTGIEASIIERLSDKYSSSSFSESLDERRGYGPGLAYFKDFPLGVGLGGTSSGAEGAGLASRGQVVDANFMRILTDLGIVGLLLFFTVLWFAVRSAFRRENGLGWAIIIGSVCIVCIGTNTLDSYYISHSFWMLLGVIDTPTQKAHSIDVLPSIPGEVAI